MKLQLTKDKTIEIALPSPKKKGFADVVGLDLSSDDARGVPAVRLVRKKDGLHLAATGFVERPSKPLPTSWEEAAKSCTWSLPPHFQAPHAAFAVNSPETFLLQTTREDLQKDILAGGHKTTARAGAETLHKSRLGLIRREPAGKKPAEEKPAAPVAVNLPPAEPGVPVSNGGTRFVMQPMHEPDFVLEAGMPEYQILWLSRLLPEGRRPTAASIQPATTAVLASVFAQSAFAKSNGSLLVLFVGATDVHLAGFRNGELALWRTCDASCANDSIRKALLAGLGLERDMLAAALEEAIVDPMPVLEPILSPLLADLAISRDYFKSRHEIELSEVLLLGLEIGARYWQQLAMDKIGVSLVTPEPFDGLILPAKDDRLEKGSLKGAAARVYQRALGAALALMLEDAP